jgi:hypothetical protein
METACQPERVASDDTRALCRAGEADIQTTELDAGSYRNAHLVANLVVAGVISGPRRLSLSCSVIICFLVCSNLEVRALVSCDKPPS